MPRSSQYPWNALLVNWDPFSVMILFTKPVDDGLDKLDYELLVDLNHRGCFQLLGEFVDGDVEILIPSNSSGKRS
jgi:hypothetical protein